VKISTEELIQLDHKGTLVDASARKQLAMIQMYTPSVDKKLAARREAAA